MTSPSLPPKIQPLPESNAVPLSPDANAKQEEASSLLGERTRTTIALLIVAGGLVLVALVWFVPAPWPGFFSASPPTPLNPEIIASPLIALIGGVSGYYFGSRGTDRAIISAAQAHKDKVNAVNDIEKELRPHLGVLPDLQQSRVERTLTDVRRKYNM